MLESDTSRQDATNWRMKCVTQASKHGDSELDGDRGDRDGAPERLSTPEEDRGRR